jgi:hypothetical protein
MIIPPIIRVELPHEVVQQCWAAPCSSVYVMSKARASPVSASSALLRTSWYQRGKSDAYGVNTAMP